MVCKVQKFGDKAAASLEETTSALLSNDLGGLFDCLGGDVDSFAQGLELLSGSSINSGMERFGSTLNGIFSAVRCRIRYRIRVSSSMLLVGLLRSLCLVVRVAGRRRCSRILRLLLRSRGTDGEHVLDAADVRAMGGQEAVYRFRAGLRRGFADGGAVGSQIVQVAAPSMVGMTLIVKDVDNQLVGRMRVEADNRITVADGGFKQTVAGGVRRP